MKQKDVKIGGEYLTKVSGARVKVRVTDKRTVPRRSLTFSLRSFAGESRTVFAVERSDNGRTISPRSAASLHPIPEQRAADAATAKYAEKLRKADEDS